MEFFEKSELTFANIFLDVRHMSNTISTQSMTSAKLNVYV